MVFSVCMWGVGGVGVGGSGSGGGGVLYYSVLQFGPVNIRLKRKYLDS